MQASELRIGNWVKTCTPDMEIMIPFLEAKVQGITIFKQVEFEHSAREEGFDMDERHITGINLTEEWLLKFGFSYTKIHQGFNQYRMGIFDISITPNGYEIFLINRWVTLKYVNQLQNLYFALINKELNVT